MIALAHGARALSPAERQLRVTGVLLLAALLLHSTDHVVRGLDVVTGVVLGAGTGQFLFAAVAVAMVFARHPAAPALAMLVGFVGALGFSAAHLLPQWSALSDPYVGAVPAPGVSAFSWVTAVVEIAADLAFGVAGLRAQLR